MGIKPFVVKDIERERAGMVASLFSLALSAASYPILFDTRRYVFYYCIFGSIFAFLCFFISFWMHPHKSFVVFKMDESGIYFHDKGPHFIGWSELKQISVRFVQVENGKKTRLLYFTFQDGSDQRFNIFYYVVSYVWTIRRLKKSIVHFSRGSVPFKYYPIWSKSSNL